MATNAKRIKLTEGCYVQKLVHGDVDPSNTLFEFNTFDHTSEYTFCHIKRIFPTKTKTIRVLKNNVIPQTLVYYHRDCLKHKPLTDIHHPERSTRVSLPMQCLRAYGLLHKCVIKKPKEATTQQLLLSHSQSHLNRIASTQQKSSNYIQTKRFLQGNKSGVVKKYKSQLDNDSDDDVDMEEEHITIIETRTLPTDAHIGWINCDTFYNEYSYRASKLACGAAIGLCKHILNGRCRNGIAIVRPPGHHCEHNNAMGFCLFNNVAVAVRVIKRQKLCKKVLIVDWDLHHGNGTQKMFYDDQDVLYFSVHRHDNGTFYPSTGRIRDHGNGYNVNVALNKCNGRYGDAAYMDIFKCILIPIALEFKPDIIVISAGFDACIEDAINGNVMAISPPCYGVLCRMLMNVCPAVAVILEGGYQLNTMCPAIAYVTWALLRGPLDNLYEGNTLCDYNESTLQLYVENTLWYKSVLFEYEFKRFVLLTDENRECFDQFYQCNEGYDKEQQQDLTKVARRDIMKKVLMQHSKYWTTLQPLCQYFVAKY